MSAFALCRSAARDIAGGTWLRLGRTGPNDRLRDKSTDVRRAHVVGWIDVCCNSPEERAGAARRNLNSFNVETAVIPGPDAEMSP